MDHNVGQATAPGAFIRVAFPSRLLGLSSTLPPEAGWSAGLVSFLELTPTCTLQLGCHFANPKCRLSRRAKQGGREVFCDDFPPEPLGGRAETRHHASTRDHRAAGGGPSARESENGESTQCSPGSRHFRTPVWEYFTIARRSTEAAPMKARAKPRPIVLPRWRCASSNRSTPCNGSRKSVEPP